MSLKQISELQLEMLGVVIERNNEGNPITIEEFYNRFNNHIDYDEEYTGIYHDYIIPNFNMPNGITQQLLPTSIADELYNREFERYRKFEQKEILEDYKESLELTKLGHEVILIRNQLSDYEATKKQASKAIKIAAISVIATLIDMLFF